VPGYSKESTEYLIQNNINNINNINLTHNGNAKVSVMVKCLVLVKINGNSPRKLLNRIRENSEMNINVLPLILSPRRVLNSLWSFINNVFHIIVCRPRIEPKTSLVGEIKGSGLH
jgi:hypothetical protein